MISNERILNANGMGLGKTVEAIAAIATANAYPAIIVVQAHVVEQWENMIERFLNLQGPQQSLVPSKADEMVATLKGQRPNLPPGYLIYLIHYGLVQYWVDHLMEIDFPAVVFDEVQELRRRDSYKYAACTTLASKAKYVWGLSGTPIYNYGEEIWSVMSAIERHVLGDLSSFYLQWCGYEGKRTVRDPIKLGSYLRQEGLMLRRTKYDSEVAQQLPPKRRKVIDINHDEGVYAELVEKVVGLAQQYDTMRFLDRGQAAREIETATRRAAGVAKAPFVADFIRSLVLSGEHVLVFAHHHDVHDDLREGLEDLGIEFLTGRQTKKEKREARRRFIDGEAKILVTALRAAAGIDGLQETGTCVVFAELDWSPAIHEQCEDRLHRYGLSGVEMLMAYYLVSKTGYDTTVMDVLGVKTSQAKGLLNEDPESQEDSVLADTAAKKHISKMIESLKRHEEAVVQ